MIGRDCGNTVVNDVSADLTVMTIAYEALRFMFLYGRATVTGSVGRGTPVASVVTVRFVDRSTSAKSNVSFM